MLDTELVLECLDDRLHRLTQPRGKHSQIHLVAARRTNQHDAFATIPPRTASPESPCHPPACYPAADDCSPRQASSASPPSPPVAGPGAGRGVLQRRAGGHAPRLKPLPPCSVRPRPGCTRSAGRRRSSPRFRRATSANTGCRASSSCDTTAAGRVGAPGPRPVEHPVAVGVGRFRGLLQGLRLDFDLVCAHRFSSRRASARAMPGSRVPSALRRR